MGHVRITACRPGGEVVDCWVDIPNGQRLEVALARAWRGVLGRQCVARELGEGESPPRSCVTLRAYDGPLLRARGDGAAAAVEASRVVGRFDVRRRDRRRPSGAWYGADGLVGGG